MTAAAGDGAVTPATAEAHLFVDDLAAPDLASEDRHHVVRVLRLRPGAPVTVADGHGRWRPARLAAGGDVEAAGDVVTDPAPAPPITVGFALVKGDRNALVVQKLTELGADRIVPFVAARSVVRPDPAKAERQHGRLVEIARQAAMQCRRTRLPVVEPVTTFAAAAALPGAALADRAGGPPSLARPTVLVGPEGGWSPAERETGLPTIRLGPHTLRAETAAITACAILAALRDSSVAEVARDDTPGGVPPVEGS
ncbi:MAG TPA: RsmE family RNA methyltransferase [Acidimicrobiales bacterium]|nr:RsmE family RNA methyltransferase [Acidimicrobiales bacterium]